MPPHPRPDSRQSCLHRERELNNWISRAKKDGVASALGRFGSVSALLLGSMYHLETRVASLMHPPAERGDAPVGTL